MSVQRDDQLFYLSYADVVATGVTMAEILDVLEVAFREKGEGRVEMPPKPGIHPGGGDNFIHAMPASIPALEAAGMKWVSGFPDNGRRGLPYITGLLILNDPATGVPIAVMDCTWLTAMRTAAASALSARHLARPDARTLGILGCGVQGRSHVEALRLVMPELERVVAYDTDAARARAFAGAVTTEHGIPATAVGTPRDAVEGIDVVVTAGPILHEPHATIRAGWLDQGAFASAVDFDSYWDPAALAELDLFTTDDRAQLNYYVGQGYFRHIPAVHADLGELVAGRRPGRTDTAQRTMAVNLGLALDDIAGASLIYARARERAIGTRLPL